jgi:tRNA threonylcarbamoyladenosine biosynthesis protein TsaE
MKIENFISSSEDETFSLGKKFAASLINGDNIGLIGDLGAGKTIFIKGICSFFDVKELVTSPTFNFINIYEGLLNNEIINIYHIDLYRIKNKEEAKEIGFYEYLFDDSSIKLIEWIDKLEFNNNINYRINISNELENENQRKIEIASNLERKK